MEDIKKGNIDILIVTEANEEVASGHLFECIDFSKYLIEQRQAVDLMINEDMPDELKERIDIEYSCYTHDIQQEISYLQQHVEYNNYKTVIFNLRKIENSFVLKVKQIFDGTVICIDEFGNRELDADIIVNPMIDKRFWNYTTKAKIYCGEQYLVLSKELQKYRCLEKIINQKIKTVTVSMGGMDAGHATYKLAEWLPQIAPGIVLNLVLGAGYHDEEQLQKNNSYGCTYIYRNVDFLAQIFFESDIVICAGGNTLHELAVLGIPTIVLPSRAHELINGRAYESKGFSFCGSNVGDFTYGELEVLINKISSQSVRERMYHVGRQINDGKGYERMYSIIRGVIE